MKYVPFLLITAAFLYVLYMWRQDQLLQEPPKKLPKFLPKPRPISNTAAQTTAAQERHWCPPFCN